MNKKIRTKKKSNLYGKPVDFSEKLNFTDTESDSSDRDDTDHLSNHTIFTMKWRPLIRQPFNFSKKTIFIEKY